MLETALVWLLVGHIDILTMDYRLILYQNKFRDASSDLSRPDAFLCWEQQDVYASMIIHDFTSLDTFTVNSMLIRESVG